MTPKTPITPDAAAAEEKIKSGAVLTGAEALAFAQSILSTASKHPRNKKACQELAECIKKAERSQRVPRSDDE